jgi:hypothetical protein
MVHSIINQTTISAVHKTLSGSYTSTLGGIVYVHNDLWNAGYQHVVVIKPPYNVADISEWCSSKTINYRTTADRQCRLYEINQDGEFVVKPGIDAIMVLFDDIELAIAFNLTFI